MNRQSVAVFRGERRAHIGIEVADLERSTAFYRALFGLEPVKARPGYAKFEPDDPSLNFSLIEGRPGRAAAGAQHFGIQVQSTYAMEVLAERLRASGIAVRYEREVQCCYAVQEKAWVADPDGNPWEVFVVLEAESPVKSPPDSPCCAAESRAPACCESTAKP
jgi:catechol 2,3-dioxygenase-like lactoylglutathione lyase family enzyme